MYVLLNIAFKKGQHKNFHWSAMILHDHRHATHFFQHLWCGLWVSWMLLPVRTVTPLLKAAQIFFCNQKLLGGVLCIRRILQPSRIFFLLHIDPTFLYSSSKSI